MSKATFYEHFDNKEECIIALHVDADRGRAGGDAADAATTTPARDAAGRVRAVIHTLLEVLATFPDEAQTLLVEIIGAGPRAMERRDRVLPSTPPTSTRSTARTPSAAARRGSPRRTTRSRSSARSSSSPRARSAPASPTTSATSSRSSSASCSGCCARHPRRRRERRAGAARRARGGVHDVPPLPAAGGVARAGRAREARGVPRRGRTGAGRSPASATRPRACCCSASRPPPTAPTARAACSPATARATSSSPRCTARASRTSRSRVHRDDGLELRDCWITAAVRCAPPANKPLPSERDNCAAWLRAELALLERARVVVCLGAFALGRRRCAWLAPAAAPAPALRPRRRGAAGRLTLLGCFHPSQQNTFTGRLTPAMLDAVLERARELAGQARSASTTSAA